MKSSRATAFASTKAPAGFTFRTVSKNATKKRGRQEEEEERAPPQAGASAAAGGSGTEGVDVQAAVPAAPQGATTAPPGASPAVAVPIESGPAPAPVAFQLGQVVVPAAASAELAVEDTAAAAPPAATARYLDVAPNVLALAADSSVSLEARVQFTMDKLVASLAQHTQRRAAAGALPAALASALERALISTASDFKVKAQEHLVRAASTVAIVVPRKAGGSGSGSGSDEGQAGASEVLTRATADRQARLALWAAQEAEVERSVLAEYAPCLAVQAAVTTAVDNLLLLTDDASDALRAARNVAESAAVVGAAAVQATRARAFAATAYVNDARTLLRGVANPAAVVARERGLALAAGRPRGPSGLAPIPEATQLGLSLSAIGHAAPSQDSVLPSAAEVADATMLFSQSQSQSLVYSQSQSDGSVSTDATDAPWQRSPGVQPRRSQRGHKTPGSVMGTRKMRTKAVPPPSRTPLALLAGDNTVSGSPTPAVVRKILRGTARAAPAAASLPSH
jgi:hypothetical protein